MAGVQEIMLRVAGCGVSVKRAGKGPPLLFLHGGGGAPRWLPFMARLAERFDVIVPEHPGFGRSETPEWLDTIGDLAFFYLDFIRQLELERVHLVGSSMGGWIAAELAVRSTHDLASLALIAPVGIRVKGAQKADIFLWSHEQLTRNLFADPGFAEVILKMPVTEEEQDQRLKNALAMAKLGWQPRLYNPHLAKWLHRIAVPTLICWGDSDRLIPPAYGPAFRDLIPGSRLQVFERCGHLPHAECGEKFVRTLTQFIEGVRP
ncbi:MAG TPA: alpha/beta fold hydrolase [Stellaceae bacterium]|nr:alpha/beta fold hydrolase [Stellaceae bacterium]